MGGGKPGYGRRRARCRRDFSVSKDTVIGRQKEFTWRPSQQIRHLLTPGFGTMKTLEMYLSVVAGLIEPLSSHRFNSALRKSNLGPGTSEQDSP